MTLETSPDPSLWGEAATATVTFDPIPDDGGGVVLSVDGGDRDRFVMDWSSGIGTVALPLLEPGQHIIDARFQPSGYLVTRWAPTTAQATHVVSSESIDKDPPVGTVSINAGAAVTLESYVEVSMHATDASPIFEVDMSCDAQTWVDGGTVDGAWGWAFGNESCTSDEGVKTVYVRWGDMFDNWGIASDTIILDWRGPIGDASIDGGAGQTDTTDVSVAAPASDAGSGVSVVSLSNNGTSWTQQPYSPTIAWSLSSGDGIKTVQVKWRDGNGHWSSPKSDTIVLDTTPPSGTISIAGGAAYTKSTSVNVAVGASDAGSGLSQVALSNDGTTWTTRTYAASQPWTLPSTNGTRTVYAKWKDKAGNWSAVKTDTIVLDTVAPTVTAPRRGFVAGTAISAGRITLRVPWSGSDATSGIARYELQQQTDGGAWTTVSTTLTSPTIDRSLATQHSYRFRVRAVDRAGNVGAWVAGQTFRISRYSESNSAIKYSGTWRTVSSSVYWGGAAKKASTAGAKASLTFTGRSIAWVSRKGPTRGKATIYVNGTKVATVDLYASTYQNQQVVWARSWTSSVSRTVTIRVAGTSGRPRVDLDALVTAN